MQGCNLNCGNHASDWVCDTVDVWKKGTGVEIVEWATTVESLYGEALNLGAHLIITGGEPLLQQPAILKWLTTFKPLPFIELRPMELLPDPEMAAHVGQWNVSPKLSNSGEPIEKRIHSGPLDWFLNQDNAIFKFVISNENDIKEINHQFEAIKDLPIRRKYLMPAADNKESLESLYLKIIELSKRHGFSLSQRFHISLWDQTTGV